jgi:hypothetical protein
VVRAPARRGPYVAWAVETQHDNES